MRKLYPRRDVDVAFKTIYLHTFSYAGTGTAFQRFYRRANVHSLRLDRHLSFRKWVVENRDFRELLRIYDKPKVLLYLDPPYLDGGQTYKYKFKLQDFKDLKELLDKHSGTYLLNLSMGDSEMLGIFGEPNLVMDHYRPTTKGTYEDGSRWKCGYWWKL